MVAGAYLFITAACAAGAQRPDHEAWHQSVSALGVGNGLSQQAHPLALPRAGDSALPSDFQAERHVVDSYSLWSAITSGEPMKKMIRVIPTLALAAFLAACTTTGPVNRPLGLAATGPSAGESIPSAPSEPYNASSVPFQADQRSGNKYFTLKGGWYGTDEGSLDDGYIINGAFGHELSNLLAVEFEGGYFEADGSLAAIDKFFGVPLMANAKLSLQVWIVEAYGGAGLGAIYNQVDFSAGGSSNDWLFAGNAFLGADAVLFEKLTAGLELKYYLTEENDLGLNADAAAAFITVGLRF